MLNATLVGVFILLPTLLFVRGSEESLQDENDIAIERLKIQDVVDTGILITDINKKISFLNSRTNNVSQISDVVARIVELKPFNISINSFRYRVNEEGDNLTIIGTTNARRNIVALVDALESDRVISQVDSPVSNLLHNSDIEFSIGLTITP